MQMQLQLFLHSGADKASPLLSSRVQSIHHEAASEFTFFFTTPPSHMVKLTEHEAATLIDTTPFVAAESFLLRPHQTIQVVFNTNNQCYPHLRAPRFTYIRVPLQRRSQPPKPPPQRPLQPLSSEFKQECLAVYNSSECVTLLVNKGTYLNSLLDCSIVRNRTLFIAPC